VVDCGPAPGYTVIYRLMKEEALRFCPMRHLRAGVPPQLICLGTQDHILSEKHANAYLEKARSFGGIGELKMYEGGKHAFPVLRALLKLPPQYEKKTVKFKSLFYI